jgi:hypothetical protein
VVDGLRVRKRGKIGLTNLNYGRMKIEKNT